jgi:hypothetical protein
MKIYHALTELLFDTSASITERDDAATELGEISDVRSAASLISKAKDLNENELVLNSCGESLGMIWSKQNAFDEKAYRILSGTARYGVYVAIKSRKPEWIEQYQLEKDNFLD